MQTLRIIIPALLLAFLPVVGKPCQTAKNTPTGNTWKFLRVNHALLISMGPPQCPCPVNPVGVEIRQPLYYEGRRTIEYRNSEYTVIDSGKSAVGLALRGNELLEVNTTPNVLTEELSLCEDVSPIQARYAYQSDSLFVGLNPDQTRISLIFSQAEGVLYSYRYTSDSSNAMTLRIEDKSAEAKLTFINAKYQGVAILRTARASNRNHLGTDNGFTGYHNGFNLLGRKAALGHP
jgi:hypothetical protein